MSITKASDAVSEQTGLPRESFGITEIVFKAQNMITNRKHDVTVYEWRTHAGQTKNLAGLVLMTSSRLIVTIGISENIREVL